MVSMARDDIANGRVVFFLPATAIYPTLLFFPSHIRYTSSSSRHGHGWEAAGVAR